MRLTLLSTVSSVVLFGLLSALPSQAFAAFEFVSQAPASEAAAPAGETTMPPVSNTPVIESTNLPAPAAMPAPVDTAPAMPSPKQGDPMPLMPPKATAMPKPVAAVKGGPIPLTPVSHDSDALTIESRASAPVAMPAAAPMAMPSDIASDDNQIVQGFGRDVPLALALQQIVPTNYRYSFDPGINPGTRVSWTGGQPWKNVISDLAQSNNMNVDIVSNVVAFRPVNSVAVPLSPAPIADAAPIADVPALPPEEPQPMTAVISKPSASVVKSKTEMRNSLKSAQQEAAFDPMMDGNGKPAHTSVKDKAILTADSETTTSAQDVALQPLMPEANAAPLPPVAPAPAPMPAPKPVIEPAPVMPAVPNPTVTAADMSGTVATGIPTGTTRASDLSTPMSWEAHKGQTLRQTLTEWTDQAGVSLVWSSEYDYPLETDVRIDAGFADATRTLLAGFTKAQPRPLGRLFNNKQVGGQAVLMVETQRLTN